VIRSSKSHSVSKAFTITELIVVVGILALLMALVIPNFSYFQVRAEGVVCTMRLKNLWTAFSTQLHDGYGWPQPPTNIPIGSMIEQQWWLSTTANTMGLTSRDWNCPTIARLQNSLPASQQTNLISYLPTLFDSKQMSPLKYPRMPWFTEALGVHGDGNLTIRADGSICPFQDR